MLLIFTIGEFTLRKTQLIMMFVLLTFVSQAFASVNVSSHMSMSSTSMSSTAKNVSCDEVTIHSVLTTQQDVANTDDCECCDHTCRCLVGSCFSVGLTMIMPSLKSDVQLFTYTHITTLSPTPQYRSSLYRPPIFA